MDKLLLYTQLHATIGMCSWLGLASGLFVVGLVLGMIADTQDFSLKTDRIVNDICFMMVLSSIVVFLMGTAFTLTSTWVSSDTQAPARWFQHIPVQEAQFFQKAMTKRKSAVSILGFATMENQYQKQITRHHQHKHSVAHNGLAAQQHALLFNTTTVTIKTK